MAGSRNILIAGRRRAARDLRLNSVYPVCSHCRGHDTVFGATKTTLLRDLFDGGLNLMGRRCVLSTPNYVDDGHLG